MPVPTTGIGFSPTTPAPASGYENVIPQGDGGTPLMRESYQVPANGGVVKLTASATAAAGDCGKLQSFTLSGAATYTLPATPPSVPGGSGTNRWRVPVKNQVASTAALTISATSPAKLDGTTGGTLAIGAGSGVDISTDGTDYFTEPGVGVITSVTTIGSSGSATLSAGVLNIPNYALGGSTGLIQLAQVTIATPAASINFASIPAGYTSLRITLVGQTSNAAGADDVLVQFNGDTGNNYNWSFSLTGAATNSGKTNATSSMHLHNLASSTASGHHTGIGSIEIVGYTTSFYKAASGINMAYNAAVPGMVGGVFGGDWMNTAVVTAIKLALASGSNFVAGTVATLYGQL